MNIKVKKDVFRYCGKKSQSKIVHTIFTHPGARNMFLYRMCNKYSNKSIPGLFFRIWMQVLQSRKNVEIPHTVKIGSGFYTGHFKNIIINSKAIIGDNCNIMQGVTIGSESRGKRKGVPVIGDRVVIGPNSVVVGNVSIGDDVMVGPLTFINSDIPSGSVVVGNPAKIVSNNGSSGYIKNVFTD